MLYRQLRDITNKFHYLNIPEDVELLIRVPQVWFNELLKSYEEGIDRNQYNPKTNQFMINGYVVNIVINEV